VRNSRSIIGAGVHTFKLEEKRLTISPLQGTPVLRGQNRGTCGICRQYCLVTVKERGGMLNVRQKYARFPPQKDQNGVIFYKKTCAPPSRGEPRGSEVREKREAGGFN